MNKNISNGEKELRRDEAQGIAVFEEKRGKKWFSENVGSHVRSGDPVHVKRSFRNMFANEVMVNIDMFGS